MFTLNMMKIICRLQYKKNSKIIINGKKIINDTDTELHVAKANLNFDELNFKNIVESFINANEMLGLTTRRLSYGCKQYQ